MMMRSGLWTRVLTCCLLVTLTTATIPRPNATEDLTFWLSYYKEAVSGQSVEVTVWVCGATGPVGLLLELLDAPGTEVLLSQTYTLQSTDEVQTVQFQIPEDFAYEYATYLRARGFGGKVFHGFDRIFINTNRHLRVFVQTDKYSYKPGEKVRFRAFAMTSDLKISNTPVDIEISDPSNNKVAEWRGLTSEDGTGVVVGDMAISHHPPLGFWSLLATVEGSFRTQTFRIEEYEDPTFDIQIDFNKNVALTSEEKVTATVSARYWYHQPVQGAGLVEVTDVSNRQAGALIARHFKLNEIGLADIEFTTEELTDAVFNATYRTLIRRYPQTYTATYLASLRTAFTLGNDVLEFKAVVTEEPRGGVFTKVKLLRFYNQPLKLRFVAPTPPTYKPELPIKVYVQAVEPDYQKPVESPGQYSVQFELYFYVPWSSPRQKQSLGSHTVALNSHSLAVWQSDPLSVPGNVTSIYIEATSEGVTITERLDRHTSPSNTYLQLTLKTPSAKVGKSVTIGATSNKEFGSFAYRVSARGHLLLFKKITQTTKSKDKEFALTVTQDMYPAADVVVFFEGERGEVVAERLVMVVDGDIANQLSLKLRKSEVEPGTKAKLKVKATPGSKVFFLGVDKTTRVRGEMNDVTKDDVLTGLLTMGGSYLYYYDNGGVWYSLEAKDTERVFQDTKIGFITDGTIPGRDFYMQYAHLRHLLTTPESVTEPPTSTAGTTTTPAPTTTTTLAGTPPATTTPPQAVDVQRSLSLQPPLWNSVVLSEDSEIVKLEVPDKPSSYVISAFAVHPDRGLYIAQETVQLVAVKRLFLTLDVPPRVVRGEDVCMTTITHYTHNGTLEASVILDQNATSYDNVLVSRKDQITKLIRKSTRAVADLGTLQKNAMKKTVFCISPKVLGDMTVQVSLKKGRKVEDRQIGQMKVLPLGVKRTQGYPVLVQTENGGTWNTTVDLDIPGDFEQDSLFMVFQVSGNLLGVSAENLRNIMRMPTGTGDQNIVNFASALYVYKFLQHTNGLTPRLEHRTRTLMMTAYQSQLKFLRSDGSFSAFGPADRAGCVRVTAAMLKSIAQVAELDRGVVVVARKVIQDALKFLQTQQNADGSFKEPGRQAHPRMKSGSVELTAFVTVALQEVKNFYYERLSRAYQTSVLDSSLQRAQAYLELKLATMSSDPYTACIVAFALSLTGSTKAAEALRLMENVATTQGTMTFWSVPLVVKDTSYEWYRDTNPLSVEATSYALMTRLMTGSINDVIPVFRWLNTQRGPYGGFITLHDTLVGLEALSKVPGLNLGDTFSPIEVKLTWRCGDGTTRKAIVTIDKNSVNSFQEVLIPIENGDYPRQISIKAKTPGSGQAFIFGQLFVSYNLARSTAKQSFAADVSVTENAVTSFVLKTCVRRTTSVTSSALVVAKIAFPSGYDVDRESSDFGAAGHVEFLERKAILYYASMGTEQECSVLRMRMTKGSVANNKPVPVRVFDLYSPDDEYTTMYSIKQFDVCEVEPNYMEC